MRLTAAPRLIGFTDRAIGFGYDEQAEAARPVMRNLHGSHTELGVVPNPPMTMFHRSQPPTAPPPAVWHWLFPPKGFSESFLIQPGSREPGFFSVRALPAPALLIAAHEKRRLRGAAFHHRIISRTIRP